jgi:hypothetical protein
MLFSLSGKVRQRRGRPQIELLAGFSREFEIRALDDGIDRTGFLAEAAIDALHHVDIIANGTTRAVILAWPSLDGYGLGRADGLAQLARDTALFAIRIAPQCVLAAKAWRNRALLEGIIDGRLGRKKVTHGQEEGRYEFAQQQRVDDLGGAHQAIPPCQPQPVS